MMFFTNYSTSGVIMALMIMSLMPANSRKHKSPLPCPPTLSNNHICTHPNNLYPPSF